MSDVYILSMYGSPVAVIETKRNHIAELNNKLFLAVKEEISGWGILQNIKIDYLGDYGEKSSIVAFYIDEDDENGNEMRLKENEDITLIKTVKY